MTAGSVMCSCTSRYGYLGFVDLISLLPYFVLIRWYHNIFINKRQDPSFDHDKVHTIESLQALSLKDKLQIATAVLGDLSHDKSERQEESEIVLNKISVDIEAVGMRLMDLEKDALMFKRDILTTKTNSNDTNGEQQQMLLSSLSNNATAIKSERLLRHFQNKALQLDSTRDKLKLQQIDQKKKLQKLEIKLKQSEEMENNFHYIDFHQLQSSNKQCMTQLKTKTRTLDKMKIAFETLEKDRLALDGKLKDCKEERQKVHKSLELRRRHFERLDDKVKRHDKQIETMNNEKQKHTERIFDTSDRNDPGSKATDVKVDIMDIVNQQTKIYELQSAIKTWTKKVEIARLVNKNQRAK